MLSLLHVFFGSSLPGYRSDKDVGCLYRYDIIPGFYCAVSILILLLQPYRYPGILEYPPARAAAAAGVGGRVPERFTLSRRLRSTRTPPRSGCQCTRHRRRAAHAQREDNHWHCMPGAAGRRTHLQAPATMAGQASSRLTNKLSLARSMGTGSVVYVTGRSYAQ